MTGKYIRGTAKKPLSEDSTRQTGAKAEQIAQRYLCQQGLVPIEHNVCFKTGELDLIMQQGNILVFVEVRYRRSNLYGSAAESITTSKQKRLIKSALLYCQQHRITSPWRIDVVTLTQDTTRHPARSWCTEPTALTKSSDPELRIDWLINAISN